MKYCTNCGTQLSDDAKFCSVCGTKQEPAKAPASEQAPPKPKKPAAPKQTVRQSPQTNTLEGNQEEFFAASKIAGEVVLSSWENPKPKAEASNPPYQNQSTQYQQQAAPRQQVNQNYRQPPRQSYQQRPNYQQAAAPQKKKRGFFSWLIIILLIIMILYFLASILEGCKNINLPPDPGTPEPEPLSGIFVCGEDTLFFNGDGKTVSWHFANSGSGGGTYTFIFGHGPCRYDVAEKLIISDTMMNKESRTFILKKPAADSLIQILGEPAADFRKLK
ncbi:MAG: zinc ribbon domain-containing protein [Bacteroidales bacterium]|nr:zinc ribbon domain-containing protein [Bacteroidales bacterium]